MLQILIIRALECHLCEAQRQVQKGERRLLLHEAFIESLERSGEAAIHARQLLAQAKVRHNIRQMDLRRLCAMLAHFSRRQDRRSKTP
ncbi:hypothetical protein CHELA20_40334 [Hyphomicrobiales bacterium]|nr:hypothetical protein CHELA20_40334 [Hyphomicrobiales bacterium]